MSRSRRGSSVGALQPRIKIHRDVAQFGSAPRLGRGGRTFESCHPDHLKRSLLASFLYLGNRFVCINHDSNVSRLSNERIEADRYFVLSFELYQMSADRVFTCVALVPSRPFKKKPLGFFFCIWETVLYV